MSSSLRAMVPPGELSAAAGRPVRPAQHDAARMTEGDAGGAQDDAAANGRPPLLRVALISGEGTHKGTQPDCRGTTFVVELIMLHAVGSNATAVRLCGRPECSEKEIIVATTDHVLVKTWARIVQYAVMSAYILSHHVLSARSRKWTKSLRQQSSSSTSTRFYLHRGRALTPASPSPLAYGKGDSSVFHEYGRVRMTQRKLPVNE